MAMVMKCMEVLSLRDRSFIRMLQTDHQIIRNILLFYGAEALTPEYHMALWKCVSYLYAVVEMVAKIKIRIGIGI